MFGTVIRHAKMKKTVTVSMPGNVEMLNHWFVGLGLKVSIQHKVRNMDDAQPQVPLPRRGRVLPYWRQGCHPLLRKEALPHQVLLREKCGIAYWKRSHIRLEGCVNL